MQSGPWFNIKMSSYRYRKSHCGDKTVVRSSYHHNGISYTGKMTSLYWFIPQVFITNLKVRMFLSLDLLWEYWIQHGANGPLYVTSSYSTWLFCRGVSGFATDCPCGVWCRGLTTCLLHVGPPFGNRILNNSWAVGLTYVMIHQIIFQFYLLKYSLFFKYSCTNIFL